MEANCLADEMSKDEFMRPPKFPWPSAIAMMKEEDGKLSLRVGNEKLHPTYTIG